ncbi:MAG: twin-arginine translocation signal domain-containing protein, partial [Rhodospirillaceae bacterium]|nr:twin-arginine translocation signal domain-containing protein [Rhodospirillaceae bacterium]
MSDLTRRQVLKGGGAVVAAPALLQVGAELAYAGETDISKLKRVKQKMVAPPMVPKHSLKADGPPKIVEVRLVVEEKQITIDGDGTKMWANTFNGSVPAPMIICHQDDYIELTLVNPASNELEHNIDLHASTGSLGGAGLT